MNRKQALRILSALASETRLQVLGLIADTTAHFPAQRDGDLVEDGVCSVFIAEKLGVSQPTTSRHMKVLLDAGLVQAKAQKGWTFYRVDPEGLARARAVLDTLPSMSAKRG